MPVCPARRVVAADVVAADLVGVTAYAVAYPLVIVVLYRRTDPDGSLASQDLIPRRVAVGYGIVMSVLTTVVAAGTAYQ